METGTQATIGEGRVGDTRELISRKRRGEFNSRELARDEIAARRLVAGDLGHNYLNARGWINCCISHAKLILIPWPVRVRRSPVRYFSSRQSPT